MVRSRTFSSFQPRRRRDQDADRRQTVEIEIGTISATAQRLLWRAASVAKITKVSLLSESTVPGANESYWSFQIYNRTKGDFELFSTAPTTKNVGGLGAITADTEYNLGVDQNLWVAANDVLDLVLTKTASAGNITNAVILLEYEVEEGPIPSIAVTTTSTSTTTTTTTTTSTTTTTTTTTTSSSTTTTSSSTTTTSSSTTTTSSSTTTTTTTTTTISTTTTIT